MPILIKKHFIHILPGMALAILFLMPGSAWSALNLSKSLSHYADEMEYYYKKPRPEILPGLLNALDKNGQLAKGEVRLMLAAFLSELARNGDIDLISLKRTAKSRQTARVLAWSAHLAQKPEENDLLMQLRQNGDSTLAAQIASSPPSLSNWNPISEKSAIQMYWGAFMASGNPAWLDGIIQAALAYANAVERGVRNGQDFVVGSMAAASLYELAPRHAAIARRLKRYINPKNRAASDMIDTILKHGLKQ